MSQAGTVHILASPTANIASVAAAVRRCGGCPVLTADARDVARAPLLVFPGVGSFGAGAAWLDSTDVRRPLTERFRAGSATLCICLGMQLLFESSEESVGARGLGVVSGAIRRFMPAPGVRVPQMGWNRVQPRPGFDASSAGYAYYANSFRADAGPASPDGWSIATSDHGGEFLAAMQVRERAAGWGRIIACQFHPELSGAWGLGLIRRWMEQAC